MKHEVVKKARLGEVVRKASLGEVVRKARLGKVVVLGVASLVIRTFLLLQVPVDQGEVFNQVEVPVDQGEVFNQVEVPVDQGEVFNQVEVPVDHGEVFNPVEVPVDDGEVLNPVEVPVDDGEVFNPVEVPVDDGEVFNRVEVPVDDGEVLNPVEVPVDHGEVFNRVEVPVDHGEVFNRVEAPVDHGEVFNPVEVPVDDGEVFNRVEAPVDHGEVFNPVEAPVDDGEVFNRVEVPVDDGEVLDPVEFDSRAHVVKACPLVFSGRSNFDSRQAVRDTWGAVVENVFFVVGERWCEIPPRFQDNASPCILKGRRRAEVSSEEFEAAVKEYTEEQEKVSRLLKKEQEEHGDIIMLDIMDSYGNLASKVRAGFKHALTFQNTSHCDWFMKIDDDAIILVEHFKSLIKIISSPRNAQTAHRVVGRILPEARVLRRGKWADRIYKGRIYPPYPQGASGYLVSKELVRSYIQTDMAYHNEDSTIGIWASENKHLNVTMEDQKRFFCSKCTPTWCHKYPLSKIKRIRFATLGHQHLADSMRRCYRRLTYPSHLIDIVKSSNRSWFRKIETLPNAVEIVEERLHDLLNRSHFAQEEAKEQTVEIVEERLHDLNRSHFAQEVAKEQTVEIVEERLHDLNRSHFAQEVAKEQTVEIVEERLHDLNRSHFAQEVAKEQKELDE